MSISVVVVVNLHASLKETWLKAKLTRFSISSVSDSFGISFSVLCEKEISPRFQLLLVNPYTFSEIF